MAVGIPEVGGEQRPPTVGCHRARLHLEGHPTFLHRGVRRGHIVDLDHDLGVRGLLPKGLGLIESDLCVANGEEGKLGRGKSQLETDEVAPKGNGPIQVRDPQNDSAESDPSNLGEGQVRSSHHMATMA
jgi:hypothetical protein